MELIDDDQLISLELFLINSFDPNEEFQKKFSN
jgi:hypothetical protein